MGYYYISNESMGPNTNRSKTQESNIFLTLKVGIN